MWALCFVWLKKNPYGFFLRTTEQLWKTLKPTLKKGFDTQIWNMWSIVYNGQLLPVDQSFWVDLAQMNFTWVDLYLVSERDPEIHLDWRYFDKWYSAELWAVSCICIIVQFPAQSILLHPPSSLHREGSLITIKFFKLCIRKPVKRTQSCEERRLAWERVIIWLCLQSRDSEGPPMDCTYGK